MTNVDLADNNHGNTLRVAWNEEWQLDIMALCGCIHSTSRSPPHQHWRPDEGLLSQLWSSLLLLHSSSSQCVCAADKDRTLKGPNAGQLKGSRFCLLRSVSLSHNFLMEKKSASTWEHVVALTKWLITPCCTLPSPSPDSSSSQPPLKMAGTSWRLSSLSPVLCGDLETEMKE